ncbi:hypothetical protein AABB24_011523 [Solanum stoloniferum]|uniref:Uncharacterized protein n=1 Tax=Solanum stoloniferum TaxID=62892 RepID=A0ABD2UDD8_9SOLN
MPHSSSIFHSIEINQSISSRVHKMARINVTEMNSEQLHQSRMAMLSESIKSIAFKKQQITKEFEKGDEVEVASQELGFIGSYYAATIICSTGMITTESSTRLC